MRIATQQATVDGTKAVAIFSCGVATTLASTSLQVGDGISYLDGSVMAALAIAFLATIAVFLLDTLTDGPDLTKIAKEANGDLQLHAEGLLEGLTTSVNTNKTVVAQVLGMLILQCLICGLVVVLTVLSIA